MYRLYGNSLRDQARAHHLPVILPGEVEPVWLRHCAEISEILAERRSSKGDHTTADRRNGLITRLRIVLRLA